MLRVAIVGLGPRGLFALERLVHHACREGAALEIDAYEPHPAPGAGPVYDPRQPTYLRMNLAADNLSAWSGANCAVERGARLGYSEWESVQGGDDASAAGRYPARALVGRYLADAFARLRSRIPAAIGFRVLPLEAAAVTREGEGWRILAGDGSARTHDEVLLGAGHGTWGVDGTRDWEHPAPLVPAVFPVGRWLTGERIPPGATVAVRGFALTFIDAALALTEGRGGRFAAVGHPWRVRYVASAAEAGAILPFSRTGRPMLAKPPAELAESIPGLAGIGAAGRDRVRALPEGLDLGRDLVPILADVVGASLLAGRGGPGTAERRRRAVAIARRWLGAACVGSPPPGAGAPAAQVARSLDVGAGLGRPDLPWALGHAWQALYPALVDRLGANGLTCDSWPRFQRLAAEMERIAFGPPALNAAKLLALVDAGAVELGHVAGGTVTSLGEATFLGTAGGRRRVDVVVDAVLPPPGARLGAPAVVRRLVADGHARVPPARRGLEVTPDGVCVGRDGHPSEGLSAIGRITEDWVIGNDTLNRSLHPHPDRWARHVARRAAASAARHAGRAPGCAA